VGLLFAIRPDALRIAAAGALVMLAALTQYTAGEKAVSEMQIINNFWQQVAWRAPGIRAGTGLVVNYPTITIGEDIDLVFGPANMIYYPQPTNKLPVLYQLFPVKQYPWTVKEYLAGGKDKVEYRSHYWVVDYGAMLVLSQATTDSCIHIINKQAPWYSYNDPDQIMLMGQSSYIRNVLPKAPPPSLKESIFGPEPQHGWCYYFEKADLALQQQDWNAASQFGEEAARLQLKPNDALEWMPFLQAYAALGDEERFAETAEKLNQNPYNRVQACNAVTAMQKAGVTYPASIQKRIQSALCLGATP
jgi:hypothetical protein